MLIPSTVKQDRRLPSHIRYINLVCTLLSLQQTCARYDFMRVVKHLKICLTIDTRTSARIAPLQYTIIDTALPILIFRIPQITRLHPSFRDIMSESIWSILLRDLKFLRCTGIAPDKFFCLSSLRFCRAGNRIVGISRANCGNMRQCIVPA